MNISTSNVLNKYRQFWQYTLVGILSTTTHYMVLFILVDGLKVLSPVPASVISFVCGACIGFICNRNFVFTGSNAGLTALSKYLMLAGVNCLNNTILMYILISRLVLYYMFAQVIATLLIFGINFIICKYWIFKQSEYAI